MYAALFFNSLVTLKFAVGTKPHAIRRRTKQTTYLMSISNVTGTTPKRNYGTIIYLDCVKPDTDIKTNKNKTYLTVFLFPHGTSIR